MKKSAYFFVLFFCVGVSTASAITTPVPGDLGYDIYATGLDLTHGPICTVLGIGGIILAAFYLLQMGGKTWGNFFMLPNDLYSPVWGLLMLFGSIVLLKADSIVASIGAII